MNIGKFWTLSSPHGITKIKQKFGRERVASWSRPWISRAVAWEFWHDRARKFKATTSTLSFFPFCSRSIPIKRREEKRREDARHLDILTHMHACMHLEKVSASAASLQHIADMGLAVTHKINRKFLHLTCTINLAIFLSNFLLNHYTN